MTRAFPFFRLNPQTQRKLQRFRSIRRGYVSFLILATAVVLSLLAELLVNSRALVVRYEGKLHFPTYGRIHTGREFGLDYAYEVNYRDLRKHFAANPASGNWVLLPPVPYNPIENCYTGETFRPRPPDSRARRSPLVWASIPTRSGRSAWRLSCRRRGSNGCSGRSTNWGSCTAGSSMCL